jgi:hypothetical protein
MPEPLARVAILAPQVTQNSIAGGQAQRISVRRDPVFSPRITFGVLPGGFLALHHDTEYLVRIFHPNGQPARTVSRPIQPKRVTRRDQDAWQERQASSASGGGQSIVFSTGGGDAPSAASRAAATAAIGSATPDFAEFMSVITAIRTDPQGRVWIQRRNADGDDRGPVDLVDAMGRYIGTLPPQPLPAAVSQSGLAAYVERDDLGVQRVAVRRLPGSWN